LQAFARDYTSRGKPLPSEVGLGDLIGGGYLDGADGQAFQGAKLKFNLQADETRPQEILMTAQLPDGTTLVGLGDGSVQQMTAATLLRWQGSNGSKMTSQPKGPGNRGKLMRSETNGTGAGDGLRR
jgi:hypothetical protein